MANGLLSAGNTSANTPMRTNAHAAGAPEDQVPAEQEEGEASNVSPEEQRQYSLFVVNGLRAVEKTAPALMDAIKGAQSPVEGLALATVMVVDFLATSAQRSGAQVSDDVLMHGGNEIMETIAEFAGAAGIHSYTDEEKEGAAYRSLDIYATIDEQRGTLDKDGIAAAFKQMVEADKAGKIDELIPGITEMAQRIQSTKKAQPKETPAKPAKKGKRGEAADDFEDEE